MIELREDIIEQQDRWSVAELLDEPMRTDPQRERNGPLLSL